MKVSFTTQMQMHHHFPLQTAKYKLQSSNGLRYSTAAMKSPVSKSALVTLQCVITACVSSHFGSSEVKSCCLASFSLLPNFRWSKPHPAALPRHFPGSAPQLSTPDAWSRLVLCFQGSLEPQRGSAPLADEFWMLSVGPLFDFHRPDPSAPTWRCCEQGECSGAVWGVMLLERGKSSRDKGETHPSHRKCLSVVLVSVFLACKWLSWAVPQFPRAFRSEEGQASFNLCLSALEHCCTS